MNASGDELPPPHRGALVLGRYEVLAVIGRGGMGVVSRARDVQTGRQVAVKRVRAEGARAEREALAAARLRHPAIVELLEAEATSEGWIIVSELVEGADLRAVLRTGEVPELDIARFAGSIVRGLAHAHQHGVVHRDVKPANILCPADPRRSGAWAKLTDFGVAALAGAETLTAVGDVVGTMAYMAPEQARGDRAGAPADVFALAVVVYEALAGMNPRRGSTAAETAARALSSMPPLARMRPDLPSAVHAAIDHCLELEPAHRGGLVDLDEGLRRLAALAASGQIAPRDATAVTRLEDRRGGAAPGDAQRAYPPMAPGNTEYADGRRPRPGGAQPEPAPARPRHPLDAHDAARRPGVRASGSPNDGPSPTMIDPRGGADGLVPYLPPPGREPIGDPGSRRAAAGDLGPHGWAGDAAGPPEDGAGGWPAPVASRGRLPRLPLRVLGTAGAAAAAAVLVHQGEAPLPLIAIAAVAFVLPRVTWLALAATAFFMALQSSHEEVAGALAVVGGLAPIVLLPRRAALWPAGGLAAGLTFVGGPAAWPALAALAPKPWLRVALAAQGAVVTSVVATAMDVPVLNPPYTDLAATLTTFVLPLAGIWMVAAVLLGVMVRGRTFAADAFAAIAWTSGVGAAMVGADLAEAAPLLWAGPAAAATIVVLVRAAMRDRDLAVQAAPY